MSNDLLINSPEYDSRFAELIKALETCAYSNTGCGKCLPEADCRRLFDTLCDKKTHYVLKDSEYHSFMKHFRGLKKTA